MKRAEVFPPRPRAVSPARPARIVEPDEIVPECPRCGGTGVLRFIASGDCKDSTGGGVYVCTCGYSTARDQLVEMLLRRLRETEDLLENLIRAALPRLTRCATGRCSGSEDQALELLRFLASVTDPTKREATPRPLHHAQSGA